MITIRISFKTPRDYWKRLKEWMQAPRQSQCKEIVDYYVSLIENKLMHSSLRGLSKEQVEFLLEAIYGSKKEAYRWIEKCYPKHNLANDNKQ